APLTAPQVHFQLDDAGVRWLFVSTVVQLEKILSVVAELPKLKGIVLFNRDPCAVEKAQRHLATHSFEGFLQHGRHALGKHSAELARREQALGGDDLATIMYTSGTTGNPKGVMLTHRNLLSNVEAVLASEVCTPDDVQLCWLPFSHIYARTMDHYRILACGALLALADSAETVVRDLAETQPTHLNSVPRFYEKALAAVASADAEGSRRRLRSIYGHRIKSLCSGGA